LPQIADDEAKVHDEVRAMELGYGADRGHGRQLRDRAQNGWMTAGDCHIP
jgi:hypothetical protein